MLPRVYRTTSLREGVQIMGAEWSPHHIHVPHDDKLTLRLSIRSISKGMSLSSLSYGTQVVVQPEERADVILLQMPRLGTGRVSHGEIDTAFDSAHYAVIDVNRVSTVQYGPDIDMLVLRINMSTLRDYAERTLGFRPEQDFAFAPCISQGSDAWSAFSPVVAALDAMQRDPSAAFPVPTLQAIESMVLSTLLLTQPNAYRETLRSPDSTAPRHVRKAEEFIQANLNRALTTEEIAAHVGVSVRALFDGFHSFRQTSPSVYARHARLSKVRKDLVDERHLSIAAIAHRHGFSHPGHFSDIYMRRYGETPRQTRRSSSRPS